jgi:hypothetical protein
MEIMVPMMVVIGMVSLGLLATVALVRMKAGADSRGMYQPLFVLGICILPVGLVFSVTVSLAFIGLAGMGAIYLVIALSLSGEWKDRPSG